MPPVSRTIWLAPPHTIMNLSASSQTATCLERASGAPNSDICPQPKAHLPPPQLLAHIKLQVPQSVVVVMVLTHRLAFMSTAGQNVRTGSGQAHWPLEQTVSAFAAQSETTRHSTHCCFSVSQTGVGTAQSVFET